MSTFSHTADPDAPQPESFAFTAESEAEAAREIAKYPPGRQKSAVMALLDIAQRQEGWLSRTAMDAVAERLEMPRIQVYEVATFYTMYRLRPIGRHHVQVCTNISCWLQGSDDVKRAAEEVFGVRFGASNEDACLEEAECLGACVNAPMVQIGDRYYEDLDYERAKTLFQDLKDGRPITPGPQVERQASAPVGGPTTPITGPRAAAHGKGGS